MSVFYMLDTNTASSAIRGAVGIDTRLAALDPTRWCISAVTRAELAYGVALRPDALRLARLVEAFLSAAVTLAWDDAAADRHGELRARLRLAGQPIGDLDEMIAAHALSARAVLVSDNVRHFSRVEGLRLEDWLRA